MTPLSITIKGFGSFVEEQTFAFPEGPGLYYMTGRNDAEPRLGRNGAGKTTLWRALTWVLFDKDARGLRAGDVANWSAPKGAAVRLDFEHEEGNAWAAYTVVRTHSPNSWKLYNACEAQPVDLVKEPENPLYAMLRLGFDTWLNTVLMAQGEPMFLDLKPGPQAELFSAVLGLDRWVGYSKRAGRLADAEDLALRGMERDIADREGRLARVRESDLSADIRSWESGRAGRLNGIAVEYERAMTVSSGLKVALDRFGGSGSRLDAAVREAADQLADREALLDVASARLRAADAALAVSKRNLTVARAAATYLTEHAACPTCGTELGADNDRALALGKAAGDADRAVKDDYGRAQTAQRGLDTAAEGCRLVAERYRQASDEAQGYARGLNAARIAWEAAERELDRIEGAADRVKGEVNPYESIQRERITTGVGLEAELGALRRRHRDAAERHERLRFWVRGFQDVRLRLIAGALEALEIEVNGCVDSNGLVGWGLAFAVDSETKGGSISRGFSVHVRSPHNDRPVPWAAWSGGEAQRLRIAAQEGLSNLIRSSTGADIPLEVWDEPTDGLSDSGIRDLMCALKERAAAERRQIWVIDHRVLDYGGFDGEVTVVKGERGSRFDI